jgi:hypothetical protein
MDAAMSLKYGPEKRQEVSRWEQGEAAGTEE